MRFVRVAVLAGAVVLLVGCGKFGPPVPPEAMSPSAVRDLTVTTDAAAVVFAWKAPDKDVRSKELRSIEGYIVIRAVVDSSNELQFSPLTFIEDNHLVERDRLREEARAAGMPTRRAKPAPTMSSFSYTDPTVAIGTRYQYRVVPVNQGGTRGAVSESIAVVFNGAASQITRIPAANLESELFDDALSGGGV